MNCIQQRSNVKDIPSIYSRIQWLLIALKYDCWFGNESSWTHVCMHTYCKSCWLPCIPIQIHTHTADARTHTVPWDMSLLPPPILLPRSNTRNLESQALDFGQVEWTGNWPWTWTSIVCFLVMQVVHMGHSVSNQQGILCHLSDFDETYCVCSTYDAHHPYQLLTTYIT